MRITKYGHACLLIEHNGVSIIADPGNWNPVPTPTQLDAIVITHEHQDHCDIDQLKSLLQTYPAARVITHEGVGAVLQKAGIAYQAIEPGQPIDVRGLSVESYGTEHAVVYGISPCRNSGYLIGSELFITGDALHDVPNKKVRVLALPSAGPWMKISEAIDYAKKIKPEVVFPVHDALYIEDVRAGLVMRLLGGFLKDDGIKVVDLPPGASAEF